MRWPLNWPDSVIAKLPFVLQTPIPTVSDPVGRHYIQFRLNNPYDPYYGSGSGTSVNYNFLYLYYKYVTVYSAKVSLTVYSRSTGALGHSIIMIPFESSGSQPLPDSKTLYTNRHAKWITMGNANTKVYHLRNTFNMNKLSGGNAGPSKDPNSWSLDNTTRLSSSIKNQWSVGIYVLNQRTDDTVYDMDFVVKVTYKCRFWNRIGTTIIMPATSTLDDEIADDPEED